MGKHLSMKRKKELLIQYWYETGSIPYTKSGKGFKKGFKEYLKKVS